MDMEIPPHLRNHPAVQDVVEALHQDNRQGDEEPPADPAPEPAPGPAPRAPAPQVRHDRPDREEQRAMPSFKMPQFDPERVERFFQEADDRFLALGIYHPVLKYTAITPFLPTQLMEAVASRHDEIIQAEDRYEALRRAVIEYSFRPYWARQHAMDTLPSVSDSMSPSQLMLRIIALKGSGHNYCESLQYQFMKRLPPHLFEKFKDKQWETADPMKFAHLVERSWAPHMAGPVYASIPHPGLANMAPTTSTSGPLPSAQPASGTQPTVAQVSEDREEQTNVLDVLRPLVAAIQAGRRGSANRGAWQGNRGNQRGGRRGGQGGQFQSNNNNNGQNQGQSGNRATNTEWCYFHQRFGSSASNCRPPCSYNQRTSALVRTLQPYETL